MQYRFTSFKVVKLVITSWQNRQLHCQILCVSRGWYSTRQILQNTGDSSAVLLQEDFRLNEGK